MVRTILNMHVHLLRNIPETNESYCFFFFSFLWTSSLPLRDLRFVHFLFRLKTNGTQFVVASKTKRWHLIIIFDWFAP